MHIRLGNSLTPPTYLSSSSASARAVGVRVRLRRRKGTLNMQVYSTKNGVCDVAPSNLAVWGRCVQKQRQQAGFKGRRRVDQTQPSGHSPDFDSFPSFLPPRPPPCLPPPPQIRRGGKNSCNARTSPFTVRLQSVHLGPGTVTLDWQIRAGLSAAGLKWCGRLRIRVLEPHLACGLD